MPDRDDLYRRIEDAVERGEPWRAKEILRGNLRLRGYDVDLYERYGRLLLDLGEAMEAGKYLFLSGKRAPEYESAISTYLSRHLPGRLDNMYFSFPAPARLDDIDQYPDAVRQTLETLDFPVAVDGRLYAQRRWREHWERERAKHPDPKDGEISVGGFPIGPFYKDIPAHVFPMDPVYWSIPFWLRPPPFLWFQSKKATSFSEQLKLYSRPGLITILIATIVRVFLLTCTGLGLWALGSWVAGRVL